MTVFPGHSSLLLHRRGLELGRTSLPTLLKKNKRLVVKCFAMILMALFEISLCRTTLRCRRKWSAISSSWSASLSLAGMVCLMVARMSGDRQVRRRASWWLSVSLGPFESSNSRHPTLLSKPRSHEEKYMTWASAVGEVTISDPICLAGWERTGKGSARQGSSSSSNDLLLQSADDLFVAQLVLVQPLHQVLQLGGATGSSCMLFWDVCLRRHGRDEVLQPRRRARGRLCSPARHLRDEKTIFFDPQENEIKDVSATGVYSPKPHGFGVV